MVSYTSLSILWRLASYIHNVYGTYEAFYKYLSDMPYIPLEEGSLNVGDWVSRSMERGFWNIGVLVYTQHHGVVTKIEDNIVYVTHFQDNKIKTSTLVEYMNGERILNVYHNNPYVNLDIDLSSWEGKYNLVTHNCEHFASNMVDGAARSRQIQVLEHIAWACIWYRHPVPPDEFKLVPNRRYYI